jgi:UDP-glucose 4-epimerase
MGQRILVTGGAGCIGSDLATALLAGGHEVLVLDNLSSGKTEHIEPLRVNPSFHFIHGDLLDFDKVQQTVRGVDMVYHLAANPDVKFSRGEPTYKDLKQNIICTYHVLESMRRENVKRLVFSSTSAVYGISEIQPIPENSPTRPISLYGATKLGCEGMISAFQHLFGMDCWIFRFANIIGSKVRKSGRTVIGDFIDKLRRDPARLEILGDGRQAKSYLLSDECIEAMLFAVDHAPQGLQIFNLGCADNLSVRRIADMVTAAMGLQNVRYEFTGGEGGWLGDVPRFLLDVTAINRLGWRAQHKSEEAIALAIRSTLAESGRDESCKR